MNFLLVGPLPEPVNGCSYANAVLIQQAGKMGLNFLTVNTSTPIISSQQGNIFSFKKAFSFLGTYYQLSKVSQADVVYLTPGQTFFGLMKYAPFMSLARLLGKSYVIHLHGNYLGAQFLQLRGIKKWLFRRYISRAAAGIVLSESLRKNFEELLQPEQVFVVENFAGDFLFSDHPTAKPTDKLEILFLSNLMREKGVFVFLESLALLKNTGISFHAYLAGNLEDGIEDDIHEYLNLLGPCVKYLGPVGGQAKTDLLHKSNVFVLPTHYPMEGQPISLLEGMATGNIILTTAHAGIPDVVNESNGYLVPIQDPKALASRLINIASDLSNEVARFSSHNKKYAASRFTESTFARKVVNVLVSVADTKKKQMENRI